MVRSPRKECPIGSMPKAGEQKDDERITDYLPFADTTTTKRDINIISKPCSKRDMPTAPKLRDVSREIGVVEVAHEFDAKEFGSSDSDVRVAGEVAIDLERKEDGSKEQC